MPACLAKSCARILASSVAVVLLVQACGGRNDAMGPAAPGADPIEGAWASTITVRDCTSGAPIRSVQGVSTFHRGGTVSDTNDLATSARAAGAGTWRAGAAAGSYTASVRFDRFNADGTPAGAQKVSRSFVLAADGNATTGTIAAQVLDSAGSVLQNLCGTETSARQR